MEDYLFIGLIIFGFFILRNLAAKKDEPTKEESIPFTQAIKERTCPPHKWTYQNIEEGTGMHCSVCKIVPGYEGR